MTKHGAWALLLSLALLSTAMAGCAGDDTGTEAPETADEPEEPPQEASNETVDPQTAPAEEIPADTNTTWYLHHTGGCEGAEGEVESIDRINSTGDDDGCGSIGTATAFGGAAFNYTATEASPAYSSGAPVNAHMHMMFSHSGYVEVQVVLLQNGTEVGSAIWAGVIIAPLVYVDLPFEFTLEQEVPAGAMLSWEVRPFGVESAYMGYEEDHSSQFTLG